MKPVKKKITTSDNLGKNAIGRENNLYHKRQAIKSLPTAQAIEQDRKAAGWLYIRKGKTRKQVHPDKLEAYQADDWIIAV